MEVDFLSEKDGVEEFSVVMARAFVLYPLMQRAFPDGDPPRESWVRSMVAIAAKARQRAPKQLVVAREGGRIVGSALVRIPGFKFPEDADREMDALFDRAGPQCHATFESFGKSIDSIKLPEPHVYLTMLGVDPEHQGKGVGSKIIERVADLAEELPEVLGVGLDTEVLANVLLYKARGFRVEGEADLDGSPIWVMFRPVPGRS